MDQTVARPLRGSSVCSGPSASAVDPVQTASPRRRKPRPGWKATIVRSHSLHALRRIQKSTTDPVIDLSYLADACVELALELGAERIVQRALASLGR